MEQAQLQNKEKAFAISLVSIIYAFVLQLTNNLVILPNSQYSQYSQYINVAIFVPAIASILFGKLIGAAGAAGGQLVNTTGTTLLTPSSTTTASQTLVSGLDLSSIVLMASGFIGAWVVGSLTEKPNARWDTLTARFTDIQTWSRLFNNTLGSVIGLGMFNSLLLEYGLALNSSQGIDVATSNFVKSFLLNSLILVIFIPATLLLYEFGDILVQMRAHAKDKSLRKVARTVQKEDAVTVISARLTDNALAENVWTPILIKFRANLDQESIYKIEAVSTANYYPAFDNTKPLKKGDVWSQKFFIMPSKQKNVEFKVRITPAVKNLGESAQENVSETIFTCNAKSYNPNSNSATLVLFSIINSIMVGASVVWNNLIQFDPNSAIASVQNSLPVVLSTGGLEVIILVPIFMYLRRRWAKSDSESLTVGFGTDLSERSQKVYQNITSNVSNFLNYFGTKLQRSLKLFLIFVTTVSALLLGVDGYNAMTNSQYFQNLPSFVSYQLLIIAAGAILLWLGGYKGIDILKSTGIIEEPKHEIQDGTVLKQFKPGTNFLENSPSEVTFKVVNPTAQKGIRFRFLSQDTISPPLVEMPVPPGGTAIFKTSITPIATGNRNLMVVAYPLFDEKDQYIDENEAEPFTHQFVNYQVQSETQIGISKDQQSKLKKLLVLVGGILALIYSGGILSNQFIGVGGQSTGSLLANNAPYLLALQIPFIWVYFYLQNKSSLIKGEMESILEQIDAMDNLAKEMNDKLDKSIVSSRTFSKTINTTLKTAMDSVKGYSAMNQLNDMISKQVKTKLGDDFTQQISKVVKNEDVSFFQQASSKVISDNFTNDFQKIIAKEQSSLPLPSQVEQNIASNSAITTNASDPTSISGDTTNATIPPNHSENTNSSDFSKPVNAATVSSITPGSEMKNELKSKIKVKIKEQYGENIKKQVNKAITQELKDKSSNSFVNQYKAELTANLKKQLSREFKKQIKNETLIDDIESNVFETLGPEIQKEITDQLGKTVFNRESLSSIAENLDSQLGTNIVGEFEDSIGTEMESQQAEKIKQQLEVKYEKEVQAKLESKIKKSINRELNKRGDQIIDDLLNSQLSTDIENKMVSTIQTTFANQIDTVVDTAIDTSIDTLLGP